MQNWTKIKKYIEDKGHGLNSPTWKSDKKNLLKIIQKAELFDIEPPDIRDFSLSKYRTIIREAKEAIWNNNIDELKGLNKYG